MTITHQGIADRLDALAKEHGAAYQKELDRIHAERLSLREACGGLGHVWTRDRGPFMPRGGRVCAICGAPEPEAA